MKKTNQLINAIGVEYAQIRETQIKKKNEHIYIVVSSKG